MQEVTVPRPPIRLGQLLKLTGIAGSGAEAKALLGEGGVTVNGETELRRGRQLQTGDVVQALGEQIRLVGVQQIDPPLD